MPPLPEGAKGDFRKLNYQRMDKWNKILQLSESVQDCLSALKSDMRWYVFADLNCGDCAQTLPVLERMAEGAGGKIEMRIILKEEEPQLMDLYLSNGSRAVPKLIAFDVESGHEMFRWGARPATGLKIYENFRNNKDKISWDDFEKELHLWYAKDRGTEVQHEVADLIAANIPDLNLIGSTQQ